MYKLIVFLPLVAAVIVGLGGNQLGDRLSQFITSIAVTIAAGLSWVAFVNVGFGHEATFVPVLKWVTSGTLTFDWGLRIDTLTAVMLVVVNTVSALVHWYSIGYMSHDPAKPRFMAYLSLFTFAMLMLVTADNLVQMFFGWEGVGLASYLLIGFWHHKPSANSAAMKAFVVNRVGDFGYSLGIFAIFVVFGALDFDTIFASAPNVAGQTFTFLWFEADILTTICLLLFVGAMGKSAQLGLHTWLPDAMEGPTPVSALIHAATMVTAGVFMLVRCSPLFELAPGALEVVAIVGATTALFAASVGLVQNDIKRVIAYSTCSQLGYMFFAIGVSAYGAAIFHLFTHAFFKALLFLGAGSVIHAMSDEQDMRNMGGIWKLIPTTYALMLIGTLALTGFPFLSGFYSKDIVLEAAYGAGTGVGEYAYYFGTAAALMTSFYSWRLIFMTFHGTPRASRSVMSHVHESPLVMVVPLVVLAIGAVGAGYLTKSYFTGGHHGEAHAAVAANQEPAEAEGLHHGSDTAHGHAHGSEAGHDDPSKSFWNGAIHPASFEAMDKAHSVKGLAKWAPTGMMVLGFLIAVWMYLVDKGSPTRLANRFSGLYRFLLNKWYFDELYEFLIVRPSQALGRFFWRSGDGRLIDGLGPDGISSQVKSLAARARRLQSGLLYHYAFIMLIGLALGGAAIWLLPTLTGG
ncbi:MAG: NADH-quinone oxidoreductase subunit L [Pseudomonadota bacterium]